MRKSGKGWSVKQQLLKLRAIVKRDATLKGRLTDWTEGMKPSRAKFCFYGGAAHFGLGMSVAEIACGGGHVYCAVEDAFPILSGVDMVNINDSTESTRTRRKRLLAVLSMLARGGKPICHYDYDSITGA